MNTSLILIRGGGDLATGITLRLYRAGLKTLISELKCPLAVRRTVSFSEAVYERQVMVEGVTSRLVKPEQVQATIAAREVPVIIDPEATILNKLPISIVVDARLTKLAPNPLPHDVPLHIGLGPGFHAGHNCHAVIETQRGHSMGRVYWEGTAKPDSSQPEGNPHRVLRAPVNGQLIGYAQIGDRLKEGTLIAEIQSEIKNQKSKIFSPFKGVLRGLIRPGLRVTSGLKIGDVDPRNDPNICTLVSDKSLAIGGGVLEAILSSEALRDSLWN